MQTRIKREAERGQALEMIVNQAKAMLDGGREQPMPQKDRMKAAKIWQLAGIGEEREVGE